MTKRKKIISTILSAIMCVGIITALTANAADTAPESVSSTEEAAPAADTEQYEEQQAHEATESVAISDKIKEFLFDTEMANASAEEVSTKLAEFGIPTYNAAGTVSLDELEDFLARGVTNPIYSTSLPYNFNMGEIANNDSTYSACYFQSKTGTIILDFNVAGMGVPTDGKYNLKTTLYRQIKGMAGSSVLEAVEEIDYSFSGSLTGRYEISNLNTNLYVYFLLVRNDNSGAGTVVGGTVTVSE